MSVHYQFKSASKKWDTITFDSAVISVLDLKRAIVTQQKMDKSSSDFDLLITNAQTGERYTPDDYLVPKNTSVSVRRMPATRAQSVRIRQQPDIIITNSEDTAVGGSSGGLGAETSGVRASDEDMKLQQVLNQGASYAPSSMQQSHTGAAASFLRDMPGVVRRGPAASRVQDAPTRGGGFGARGSGSSGSRFMSSSLPSGYVCHRCRETGHHIRNCPTNGDPAFNIRRPKAATGIPRSFLKTDGGDSGNLLLADGTRAEMMPNEGAFSDAFVKHEQAAAHSRAQEQSAELQNLTCTLCRHIYTDPEVTPCCFTTYCSACIRQCLLADGAFTCPSCAGTDIAPDSLRPNRAFEKLVAAYNERVSAAEASPAPIMPPSTSSTRSPSAPSLSVASPVPAPAQAQAQAPAPAAAPTPDGGAIPSAPSAAASSPRPAPAPAPAPAAAPLQSSMDVAPRPLRPSEGGPPLSTFCGRCGQEGHLSRDCPTVPPPPQPRFLSGRRGGRQRSMPYEAAPSAPAVAAAAAAAYYGAPMPGLAGVYDGPPPSQYRPHRARSRSPRRRRSRSSPRRRHRRRSRSRSPRRRGRR